MKAFFRRKLSVLQGITEKEISPLKFSGFSGQIDTTESQKYQSISPT